VEKVFHEQHLIKEFSQVRKKFKVVLGNELKEKRKFLFNENELNGKTTTKKA
jgi:hypothetical protein